MKTTLSLYPFKQRFWPVLLLAAMVVLFFWDSFLVGKALLMRDMFFDGLRWRQFAAEAFWDGAIPFGILAPILGSLLLPIPSQPSFILCTGYFTCFPPFLP